MNGRSRKILIAPAIALTTQPPVNVAEKKDSSFPAHLDPIIYDNLFVICFYNYRLDHCPLSRRIVNFMRKKKLHSRVSAARIQKS